MTIKKALLLFCLVLLFSLVLPFTPVYSQNINTRSPVSAPIRPTMHKPEVLISNPKNDQIVEKNRSIDITVEFKGKYLQISNKKIYIGKIAALELLINSKQEKLEIFKSQQKEGIKVYSLSFEDIEEQKVVLTA